MDPADIAAINKALIEIGEEVDPYAGVLVYPKEHCPHLPEDGLVVPENISAKMRCAQCNEDEVCLCGQCGAILCSRGRNGHMLKHAETEGHTLSLNMVDLSFWCYECDSYLDVFKIPALHPLFAAAHVAKFGEEPSMPVPSAGGEKSSSSSSGSGAAAPSSSSGGGSSGVASSSS